jgi:SnoaL-like domain
VVGPSALRWLMATVIQTAVDAYIRTWTEADPAVRAALLEAHFAPEVRFVTRTKEVRGRAAFAKEMAMLLADPQLLRIRLVSAVDARGTTFRFRAVADRRDGTSPESCDVGEIDAEGKISLVLTFAGPLGEAQPQAH